MAASEVDICNLALLLVGGLEIASLDDKGIREARLCKRFYPHARDVVLQVHDWAFAAQRKALALSTDDSRGWGYCYIYPAGCIKIRRLALSSGDLDTPPEYRVEAGENGGRRVFTDLDQAWAVFTGRVVDPNAFTPLFTDTLVARLALYLAPVLIPNEKATLEFVSNSYLSALQAAEASDALEDKEQTNRLDPSQSAWLTTRK